VLFAKQCKAIKIYSKIKRTMTYFSTAHKTNKRFTTEKPYNAVSTVE